MLRNYLKTAWRHLRRSQSYTFINVAGLAMGVACCLLIGLWVQDELSYDEHFDRADRIFRLATNAQTPEGIKKVAKVPPAWGPALKRTYPAVENVARFTRATPLIGHGENKFRESVLRADSTFLEVFGLELLRGNPETALSDPSSIVISERVARKHFGDENPIGKTLSRQSGEVFGVTGVMENLPPNTHFEADIVTWFPERFQDRLLFSPSWRRVQTYSYVVLSRTEAAGRLEEEISALLARNTEPEVAAKFTPVLQPITSIHLRSDRILEIQPGGDIRYVWLFSAVALFVLLVACVNFMNLATAQSMKRAGEVGVRKVFGARRRQISFQFLGEAILTSTLAVLLALVLARLALPFFNEVAGKDLALAPHLAHPLDLSVLALGTIALGLAAGSYPALHLAGFAPTKVLRGGRQGTAGRGLLRRALVVFQFATAIALIIGTAVVYQQLRYVQSKNLGFDKEQLVVLPAESRQMQRHEQSVKDELQRQPGVQSVATGASVPGDYNPGGVKLRFGGSETANIQRFDVGSNYAETLGLKMAAGRWFSDRRATDSTAFVVNETAVQRLGAESPEDLVGKELARLSGDEVSATGRVIGVVQDFNYASLREELEPLVFTLGDRINRNFVVKVSSQNAAGVLSNLEDVWKRVAPGVPFQYSFLDEIWESLYRAEQRIGTIFAAFAGLTVLIACLGLFGLAAHAAERRRKEIGIRKAMGASAASVVALLSKDFLKLVGVGFVLAVPPAWYGMQRWLEGFAYRIDLGPLVFAGAGALALLIALAATGTQALRAARTNPAEVLRDE